MDHSPIEFHTLLVFRTVAEHLNLTLAGEELGLTQGAVSLRIQDLEESPGVSLLKRTIRRMELTPAGEHWIAFVAPLICSIVRASAFDHKPRQVRVRNTAYTHIELLVKIGSLTENWQAWKWKARSFQAWLIPI